jgi:phage terminase Nu1 subunit (DNA packaging protein)
VATADEVGAHLDLSGRRIRGLVKEGVLPAGKGYGGLDESACRLAYIRYLRGKATSQVRESELDTEGLELEELKLRRAQRINYELKNAQLQSKVAPVAIIEQVLGRVCGQLVAILDSAPLQIVRQVPSLSASAVEIMKRELAKARNAAADVTVHLDELIPTGADDAGDIGPDPEGDPSRA